MTERPILIFTDLDGTLLNHDDYSWQAAKPALERLAALQIPLVIVTSKTLPEVSALRQELQNDHPFVVENGAVSLTPVGYFGGPDTDAVLQDGLELHFNSPPRDAILDSLREIKAANGWSFRGFEEMGIHTIRELTGLDEASAQRANDRLASEPVYWEDRPEALPKFKAELASRRLRLLQGGRFLHVLGQADKGQAVAALRNRFTIAANGKEPLTLCLGDGPNDLDMLAVADIAVIVKGRHAHPMPLEVVEGRPSQIIRTDAYGPQGWSEAVLNLLEE